MCPTYAFINRSDGKFNSAMGFAREYAALLSAMWDNAHAVSQYLMDPEADLYETIEKMGIIRQAETEYDVNQSCKVSQVVMAMDK